MAELEHIGKSLASLIGEIEAVYEKRWEKSETQNLRADDRERREEARDLLRAILPPAMRAPRGELVNRIVKPELFEAANRWQWSDGNMLFAGPTGIGKTSAVAFLVTRLVYRGMVHAGPSWDRARGIVMLDVRELGSRLREHPLGKGEAEVMREARNAALLILDDIAADADAGALTEILNHRYQHQRQTVSTTGLNQQQLTAALGQACTRRLLESTGAEAVSVFCFQAARR